MHSNSIKNFTEIKLDKKQYLYIWALAVAVFTRPLVIVSVYAYQPEQFKNSQPRNYYERPRTQNFRQGSTNNVLLLTNKIRTTERPPKNTAHSHKLSLFLARIENFIAQRYGTTKPTGQNGNPWRILPMIYP